MEEWEKYHQEEEILKHKSNKKVTISLDKETNNSCDNKSISMPIKVKVKDSAKKFEVDSKVASKLVTKDKRVDSHIIADTNVIIDDAEVEVAKMIRTARHKSHTVPRTKQQKIKNIHNAMLSRSTSLALD